MLIIEKQSGINIGTNTDCQALLPDLPPPKILNNARAPLGARALLKEFLAGVNKATMHQQEVFITIIITSAKEVLNLRPFVRPSVLLSLDPFQFSAS